MSIFLGSPHNSPTTRRTGTTRHSPDRPIYIKVDTESGNRCRNTHRHGHYAKSAHRLLSESSLRLILELAVLTHCLLP